jgi:hypothetical protein
MAKLKQWLTSDLAKGVAIGVGVAAAGLLLVPALRPATRSALKSGILIFEKGREWIAEAEESLEDLVAEVRAELAEERLGEEAAAEDATAAAPESQEAAG